MPFKGVKKMKNVNCEIDQVIRPMRPKKDSKQRRAPRVAQGQSVEDRSTCDNGDLDLSAMTSLERKVLQIALGVLRSNTDYGDFLNFWLQDYGRQILSPNPPPPLLPELSAEEERMLVVRDVPAYVH
jgi:hypothetical protein